MLKQIMNIKYLKVGEIPAWVQTPLVFADAVKSPPSNKQQSSTQTEMFECYRWMTVSSSFIVNDTIF